MRPLAVLRLQTRCGLNRDSRQLWRFDSANKYLSHWFVESPGMMKIYNGNVTTDAWGEAIIRLPNYFAAIKAIFNIN